MSSNINGENSESVSNYNNTLSDNDENFSMSEYLSFEDCIEVSYSDCELDLSDNEFKSTAQLINSNYECILPNDDVTLNENIFEPQDTGPLLDYKNSLIEDCSSEEPKSSSSITVNIIYIDGKKYYTCPDPNCNRVCSTTFNLKTHYMLHTGELPFTCTFCDKKFNRKIALTNHERTHTGERPYPCKYDGCDKSFKTSSDYMKHSRIHTEDRKYKCDFENCTSSFKTKSVLKTHMDTHTNNFRFNCQHCSKKFRSATNLKNHERTHTGEKPFKCKICEKDFREYSTLYRHLKSHERSSIPCPHSPTRTFKTVSVSFIIKIVS